MIVSHSVLATWLGFAGPAPSHEPSPSTSSPQSPATTVSRASATTTSIGSSITADEASDLTLLELFGLLRQKNPRHLAYKAQSALAKSRVTAAKVLPNPIFNFQLLHMVSGYNQNGFGTYTVFLQQPLYVAGQRTHRQRAAKAGVRAHESSIEASFHALAAEGRHNFATLQARQDQQKVLQVAVADLERVRDVIAARQSAGAESRYDVAFISLEVEKWRAREVEIRADITDVATEIGMLVGRPGWQPRAKGMLQAGVVDIEPQANLDQVERTHPALRAARDDIEARERDITVARRDAWPQPTIGLGFVGIDNFFSMSALVGLVMPLPFFDWGQGEIAKAKARATVSRAEHHAVTNELHSEVRRASAVLKQHRNALAEFERVVLTRTTELQKMAENAYLTGQASIIELINAMQARHEMQMQQLALLEQVVHAEINLLHATGRVEEIVQ